jgi:hypothetical protein
MNDVRLLAGMATVDIADLEHATQLRIADKPHWSNQDFAWVIAHLEAKTPQRTRPNMPAKGAGPKRRRVPLRTWPI